MSHDFSSQRGLPPMVVLLALSLMTLPLLALPRTAEAGTPPVPKLSGAQYAALVKAACAPGGCVRHCPSKPDPRAEVLAVFPGYFDGGSQLEAFVALGHCSGSADVETNQDGRNMVFLRREGSAWRIGMNDGGDFFSKCRVMRAGDRDILGCLDDFWGHALSGVFICTTIRDHGTRSGCHAVVFLDPVYGCPYDAFETAVVTKMKIRGRTGSAYMLAVYVTVQKQLLSRKAPDLGDHDKLCEEAEARNWKHDNGVYYRKDDRVLLVRILDDGTDRDGELTRQLQQWNTDAVTTFPDW
jgi:hypothetical protein